MFYILDPALFYGLVIPLALAALGAVAGAIYAKVKQKLCFQQNQKKTSIPMQNLMY